MSTLDMKNASDTRAVSITSCVVMAVITLAIACGLYFAAIDSAGFPDGHLTDYQRWALPLHRAAVGSFGSLVVVFVGLAASRTASPVASRLFRASVLAVLVLAIGVLVLPSIGMHVLDLEHGQGG